MLGWWRRGEGQLWRKDLDSQCSGGQRAPCPTGQLCVMEQGQLRACLRGPPGGAKVSSGVSGSYRWATKVQDTSREWITHIKGTYGTVSSKGVEERGSLAPCVRERVSNNTGQNFPHLWGETDRRTLWGKREINHEPLQLPTGSPSLVWGDASTFNHVCSFDYYRDWAFTF